MTLQVQFTRSGERDLRNIRDWIAERAGDCRAVYGSSPPKAVLGPAFHAGFSEI